MVKGLYFPGLRPDEVWARALQPLLEQLVVYAVVEDEPGSGEVPLYWAARVVAPLGADRSRFLSLLREMTGRDAESFRGQMLALSSRSNRDQDEATVGSLTSALHRLADGGDGELQKIRVERLWQARLFLRLAEVVKDSEVEVDLGLAAIANRQAEMLKALQGEDDADRADELAPVAPKRSPGRRQSFRTRDRLAAWAVFYLLDPGRETLLLTDDFEAAALLSEAVEKLAAGRVVALPDLFLGGENINLAAIGSILAEIVAGKIEEGMAALLAVSEAQRTPGTPGAVAGLVLRLQLLPGGEFCQVMAALSGLPDNDCLSAATPYVLVGAASLE